MSSAPSCHRLSFILRRSWAVLAREMGRIVYCAWLIPCDHGVQLVPNPTYLLEGEGVGLCIPYSPSRVRSKPTLCPGSFVDNYM